MPNQLGKLRTPPSNQTKKRKNQREKENIGETTEPKRVFVHVCLCVCVWEEKKPCLLSQSSSGIIEQQKMPKCTQTEQPECLAGGTAMVKKSLANRLSARVPTSLTQNSHLRLPLPRPLQSKHCRHIKHSYTFLTINLNGKDCSFLLP